MKTLLIDGDLVAYKFAAGGQQVTDWGDGVTSNETIPEGVLRARVRQYIENLTVQLKAFTVVLCLSCDSRRYFRHNLWPAYKAGRGDVPVLRKAAIEYLSSGELGPVVKRKGLEADDVMGMLASEPNTGKVNVMVCNDKDMKTIPGILYNPDHPELGERTFSVPQADYWHYFQTITGDSIDGYPGCPKAGPVAAKRCLDAVMARCGPNPEGNQFAIEAWPEVVSIYKKKGLTEDDAILQARLARILRHSDFDYTNKVPILWTPPRS